MRYLKSIFDNININNNKEKMYDINRLFDIKYLFCFISDNFICKNWDESNYNIYQNEILKINI